MFAPLDTSLSAERQQKLTVGAQTCCPCGTFHVPLSIFSLRNLPCVDRLLYSHVPILAPCATFQSYLFLSFPNKFANVALSDGRVLGFSCIWRVCLPLPKL